MILLKGDRVIGHFNKDHEGRKRCAGKKYEVFDSIIKESIVGNYIFYEMF